VNKAFCRFSSALITVVFSQSAFSDLGCPQPIIDQCPSGNTRVQESQGTNSINYTVSCFNGTVYVIFASCQVSLIGRMPYIEIPPSDQPANQCGSIISVDTLALGEPIAIQGTEFYLNYSSDRIQGRTGDYTLKTPFAVPQPDPFQTGYRLEYRYLGRVDTFDYPVGGPTVHEFVWDGKDLAGLSVPGSAEIQYKLKRIYSNGTEDFPINLKFVLGAWKTRPLGLGGWSVSHNHFYDHLRKRLWSGSGGARFVEAFDVVIDANARIKKVDPQVETPTRYLVVSADSSEAYLFSREGWHLETRSTRTGAILYQFAYSPLGKLLLIRDSFSNETVFDHSPTDHVLITSPDGLVTRLNLDSSGWASKIIEPGGREHVLTALPSGLLVGYRTPMGAQKTMTYNSLGYLERDEHQMGSFWAFLYTIYDDGLRRIISMRSALNRQTSYDIRIQDTRVSRTETLPGGSAQRYFDYRPGQFMSETEPSGKQSVLSFSTDPRFSLMSPLVSLETHSSGTQTRSVSRSKNASFSSTDLLRLTSESEVETRDNKNWSRNFDGSTLVETQESPVGRVSRVKYNQFDQVIETQSASFLPMQYFYDTRGRVERIVQGARETVFAYNPSGYLQSQRNPLGQTTSYTYDAKGDLIQATLPDSRIVQFGYDAGGNLSSVTPSGRPASGLVSNLWEIFEKYIAPSIGGKTFETTYSYNLDKQLTLITRADQSTVSFNYSSASGLLSSMTAPEGTYAYGYNLAQQVETITAPSGANIRYTYNFDLLAKVQQEGLTDSTASVSYTYDKRRLSNITVNPRLTTQASSSINLAYDNDDLLTGVGSLAITREPATGLVSVKTLNQVSQTYGYDASYGELSSHVARAPVSGVQTTLFSESITRDALGRIDTKTEFLNNTTTTYRYQYDLAGRLEKVFTNGSLTRTYVYDSNSNRLKRIQGSTTQNATYDAQDRILTLGNKLYTHNDRGELSQTRVNTATGEKRFFTYNSLGAIESVRIETTNSSTGVVTTKLIEYVNDARGLRVLKKVNGTINKRYVWDAHDRLTAELDSTGKITTHYVYAGSMHVPEYMIQGTTVSKFIHDHLGSVRLVLNAATGAVRQRRTYDEFGRIVSETSATLQPFGFAGGLYDTDTKLLRFGARDYDPETGRWTSKDPILFAGGDTNLYGYVLGDPINLIDPSGLKWEYDRATGDFTYINDQTGARTPIGSGYSGTGPGRNNPAMSSVQDVGPIPPGFYQIGNAINSPTTGPNTLPLTPMPGTNTFGRFGFLIHGNNATNNASTGCIILGPDIRRRINESGDRKLEVK